MPSRRPNLKITIDGLYSLADACERGAMVDSDGNFSFQDAVGLVRHSAWLDEIIAKEGISAEFGSQRSQELATEAFLEMRHRSHLLGDSYPFDVSDYLITCKRDFKDMSYPFLLALSYTVYDRHRTSPTRIFEQICTDSARHFIGGDALHFGWPRPEAGSFLQALGKALARVGEGMVHASAPHAVQAKDGGLDVIAWRNFPDQRPTRLIALGQCAAGKNWETKTKDLVYDSWAKHWLAVRFHADPVRILFLPRLLEDDNDWKFFGDEAGIVFDRHRIAQHAPWLNPSIRAKAKRWVVPTLKVLRPE